MMRESGTDVAPTLDRSCRVVLMAATSLAAVALVALIATDSGLSGARYLRDDGLFRSAAGGDTSTAIHMADLSGTLYHLPDSVFARRSLLRGHLPLWNRHQAGGYSPLVQLQGALLSPLRWPLVLVPERHVEDARILFGLALAFAGTYSLLRWLRCHVDSALLGAAIFTFSADLFGFALLAGSPTYPFLPWLALAGLGFRAAPTRRRFLVLALAVTLAVTSGHPELVAAVGLSTAALLAADHFLRREGGRHLAWTALAAGLGIALSAWALLPFVAALATHWTYKLEVAIDNHLRLADTLHMLEALACHARRTDVAEAVLSTVYLGPATIALALLGLRRAVRLSSCRFLLVTLPLGLIACIPGMWEIGPYACAMLVFNAALAAAVGWEGLRPRLTARWRTHLAAGAMLACVLPVLAVSGCLLIPVRDCWLPPSGGWQYLLSDPGTFRIATFNRIHAPDMSVLTGIDDVGLLAVLIPARCDAWFQVVDPGVPSRMRGALRRTPHPTSPLMGGFNVKYVLRPSVPTRHDGRAIGLRAADGTLPIETYPLREPGFVRVYRDAFVEIFRNDASFRPRCDFARALQIVPGLEAAQAALLSNADHVSPVDVVEAADPATARELARHVPPVAGHLELRYPSESEVTIDVEASTPALVVLNDALAEGWSATVDGRPAPIHPVNVIARGVFVEPGTHEIRMSYWPPGLTEGLAVTALAGLLLVLACRELGRPGRPGHVPPPRSTLPTPAVNA
jgi:hypothetical protein